MYREGDVNQKLAQVLSILHDTLQGMQGYVSNVRRARGAVKKDFLTAALRILQHLPLKHILSDVDIGVISLEEFESRMFVLQSKTESLLQQLLQQIRGQSLESRTARVHSAYLLMERAMDVLMTGDVSERELSVIDTTNSVCSGIQGMLRLLNETKDAGVQRNAALTIQIEKALRLLQQARKMPGSPLPEVLDLGKKVQKGHGANK